MASSGKKIVEARAVVKHYGDFEAVRGIDFHIEAGECFGLLGPNGAGKTTTVRMLCCVLPLTQGEISVFGLDAGRNPREIKARLGVCPQENNLDPDFGVRQNLIVFSRYFDIPKAEAGPRADEVIKRFRLEDKAGVCVEDLSGGLKRRLMVARCLINKPDMVILDEPTAGLDPQSKRQIWDEVKAMKDSGVTVLLTTHNMEEAQLLCDRLIIVDTGRIISSGTPAEIVEKNGGGTLEDVFLRLTGKQLRE
ncbi:MAG: ATP-binding cassette domain-containing protein [Elusimicrobia bacterium]|nr:ATP-binding cassette domain-containing protein [Elusimicrobiota bacterium]